LLDDPRLAAAGRPSDCDVNLASMANGLSEFAVWWVIGRTWYVLPDAQPEIIHPAMGLSVNRPM
jgi:hypothetical protein